MPSGHTQKILEGATARQFAEHCARSVGYFAEYRDESFDMPLPTSVSNSSLKYHQEQLELAQKRLKHVKKMSEKTARSHARTDYYAEKNMCERALAEKAENCFKLASVLGQVADYVPPTPDHVDFRKYMLDQIRETVKWDGDPKYYRERLAKLKLLSPKAWKEKEVARHTEDVAYHSRKIAEETAVNERANKWIAQLHKSLDKLG